MHPSVCKKEPSVDMNGAADRTIPPARQEFVPARATF
jgi:hypothetical protein